MPENLYPMTLNQLDVLVGKFAKAIAEKDPKARVELRYGFNPDEYFIIVRWGFGNVQNWALNATTGEWVMMYG